MNFTETIFIEKVFNLLEEIWKEKKICWLLSEIRWGDCKKNRELIANFFYVFKL